MRADANVKLYVNMHVSQCPGRHGADSQWADVCVVCLCVCLMDGLGGQGRR